MYTVSFQSTHQAIKAKTVFSKYSIQLNVIPTPRAISSSCGMSIQILDDTPLLELQNIIQDKEISIYGIFNDNLEKVSD